MALSEVSQFIADFLERVADDNAEILANEVKLGTLPSGVRMPDELTSAGNPRTKVAKTSRAFFYFLLANCSTDRANVGCVGGGWTSFRRGATECEEKTLNSLRRRRSRQSEAGTSLKSSTISTRSRRRLAEIAFFKEEFSGDVSEELLQRVLGRCVLSPRLGSPISPAPVGGRRKSEGVLNCFL